jgi:hypothetical protein
MNWSMRAGEISILVDTMSVINRVTQDGGIMAVHDRPDMVLGREDAYRVDRRLLVGWKTKVEQRSGWAKQGQEVNEPRQKGPGPSLVMRPKKWTCNLTLRSRVVGNNTNLKVMFNQSRHNHSAFHSREGWTAGVWGHEVAVLRWRGARVQQLRVQGAGDGLDGPYTTDQGQGGELYRDGWLSR